MLYRHPKNPILKPNPENSWETRAVFNGSIVKQDGKYVLLYRAMGEEEVYQNKGVRLSTIGKAVSDNGADFYEREQFIKPEYDWEKYGCEDPRVTKIDDKYLVFYTALSNYPPNYMGIRSALAISHDLKTVDQKYLITPFNAKAMTIFPEKIDNRYTVLLTVNTDKPPTYIAFAQFEKLETLWDMFFWRQWYENIDDHTINLRRISDDQVEVGAAPIKTKYGWLLIYSYIKHYFNSSVENEFRIEGVLLDLNNPKKITGRIEKPLLTPEAKYEVAGQISNIVFPSGALIEDNKLKIYYGGADTCVALATADWPMLAKNFEINAPYTLKCQKFPNNPLLQPIDDHPWESKGVFNPGVIELKEKTFLVYRALSKENVSNFGLAISHDGFFIDERLPEPIYPLRTVYEKPIKSGLSAGVEDARITKINDTLYMCYTAFDGKLPRLAITSITVDDFLGRRWTAWAEPKIISPPGVMDKDGALFPEKINGRYVLFHRVEPNIVVDFVEDLGFKKKAHLESHEVVYPRNKFWDGVKIGINGPPVKTPGGWLVFYHGISKIDGFYRIGALILDLNDTKHVIARSAYPILEPEADFEKEGLVNNVVFSCGHVVKNDDVYVYYGGADKVVCGAKISLSELIDYVLKSRKKKYLDIK